MSHHLIIDGSPRRVAWRREALAWELAPYFEVEAPWLAGVAAEVHRRASFLVGVAYLFTYAPELDEWGADDASGLIQDFGEAARDVSGLLAIGGAAAAAGRAAIAFGRYAQEEAERYVWRRHQLPPPAWPGSIANAIIFWGCEVRPGLAARMASAGYEALRLVEIALAAGDQARAIHPPPVAAGGPLLQGPRPAASEGPPADDIGGILSEMPDAQLGMLAALARKGGPAKGPTLAKAVSLKAGKAGSRQYLKHIRALVDAGLCAREADRRVILTDKGRKAASHPIAQRPHNPAAH